MCALTVLLFEAAFSEFRRGFADVVLAIFIIILMISLVVTVYFMWQGQKDSAQKMFKWIIVGAVGFILISIIRNL